MLRSVFTWLEGISKEAYVTTLSGILVVDLLRNDIQNLKTSRTGTIPGTPHHSYS